MTKNNVLTSVLGCIMLLALAGASCEKPIDPDIPNPPNPSDPPDTVLITQPRVERWILLAQYSDYLCGYSFNFTINEAGPHKDLYDTNLAGTYVNWTNGSYLSHSAIDPFTGVINYPRQGEIIYENNDNDPNVFPLIQFEYGFCSDQSLSIDTKWEISYYGDYTSEPYREFNFTTAFIESYNVPNQFVVLRTDQYYGNHELLLYFAVFNYNYWPF
jgi:hypothetical protein